MSNCKDAKGNTIEVGHYVVIVPRTDLLWFAKVVEVSDGGISIADGNSNAQSPSKVRVVLDITLTSSPHTRLFPVVCRIITPQSEELLNKMMTGESEKTPPVTM